VKATKKNIMKKQSRNWMARFSPVFLITLIGCSMAHGQDVRSNYMPGTDFSKYRTYKWVTIEAIGGPDQILGAQIKRAIDSQLVSRGLTKVDSGNADLLLGYQTALNHERQWNANGMFDRFGWGMGSATGTATSSTIDVGTLVLNMYDPAAKQLIWTGTATKTIDGNKDPQKIQKNLDKAMRKLLKDFPPGRK
jgi:hypothetical protein